MLSKILNVFELLVLLLIINSVKNSYYISSPFFYGNSFWFRILLDIVLGIAIFIRLKDLILNFSKKKVSYTEFYLPFVLYSIATVPDIWQVLTIRSYLHPVLIISALIGHLLPIFILLGRIIFTKKHWEAATYTQDILDMD